MARKVLTMVEKKTDFEVRDKVVSLLIKAPSKLKRDLVPENTREFLILVLFSSILKVPLIRDHNYGGFEAVPRAEKRVTISFVSEMAQRYIHILFHLELL